MTRHLFHITELFLLSSLFLSISYAEEIDYATAAETASKEFGAPLITPTERDLTNLPNSDRTLVCHSNEQIEWKAFEEFPHSLNVEYNFRPDEALPYEGILRLQNIDYTHVGYFYCIKHGSKQIGEEPDLRSLEETFQLAKIYIFVEDPQNPLVNFPHPFITAIAGEEVTIPCKPTSKSVTVEIRDSNKEVKAPFDPHTGFHLDNVSMNDNTRFKCQARNRSIRASKAIALVVEMQEKFINRPAIESETGNYATEGEDLVLKCTVSLPYNSRFEMNWILPNNQTIDDTRMTQSGTTFSDDHIGRKNLTIKNLDLNRDSGLYMCQVSDFQHNRNTDRIQIKVLGKGESDIELKEPSNALKAKVKANSREVKFRVEYKGHPKPHVTWYDTQGREIPTHSLDGKLSVQFEKDVTLLVIRSPQLEDSGKYTVTAHNNMIEKKLEFELSVLAKPIVMVEDVFVRPNDTAHLVCNCSSYPESIITWRFVPCRLTPTWPTCDDTLALRLDDKSKGTAVRTDPVTSLGQRSVLSFVPRQPGKVTCNARNIEGSDEKTASLFFSELNQELEIFGIGSDPIAEGDEITLTCGASAFKYSGDLKWYFNGEPIESSEDMLVTSETSEYTYYRKLHWKSVKKQATGHYECRANLISDDSFNITDISLNIVDPQKPVVEFLDLNSTTVHSPLGGILHLTCAFGGIPKPTVEWFLNDHLVVPSTNDTRVIITNYKEKTVLYIRPIMTEDEGKYKCEAKNRLGSDEKIVSFSITNLPSISSAIIAGVVALILILLSCTICLMFRVRRERRLYRELKAAGLANFVDGNPESINPDLALDEQADLLPYDKKYEFPRENLNLGKQLGAGAFGVVVKARARNILPYEEETKVAVKMIKPTADNEVIKALISELKIMVHLGQHLNVVNLLGAVTKNISNREVMVIVEYCRFGNVQNFLIKNRENFVDQIIRDDDTIDPTILTKEQRWSKDSGYEYYNSHKNDLKKSTSPPPSGGYMRHSDYFPGGMDSANTEASLLSRTSHGGEDNLALSNNSVQPAWRSNYRSDYKGPARTVTTSDLVCWSFQVARGMQYLSSRKVLHGDLAARNILLCDDNVVKICDFGLARSMYKNDNYKKKGEAPLPFKWLAIESIGDQIFSTYSDVWSFGVVMWEFFTLGKVPYPGMDADQSLYFKLKDGYRMEQPEFANRELYDVMLDCWKANAESRPLFDALEKRLGRMLEKGVSDHYLDLNDPYMQMNANNYTDGRTDYLAMLTSPEYPAPTVPNYVNGHIADNSRKPDYQIMSPPNTNSPHSNDVSHFQFPSKNSPTTANNLNSSPSSKLRVKNPVIPEEIPMLKQSNQSINTDSETEHHSLDIHDGPNKYAPNNVTKPQPLERKSVNVLNASADNYVNVPSTIINIDKPKDAVSNPSYIMVGNINETKT